MPSEESLSDRIERMGRFDETLPAPPEEVVAFLKQLRAGQKLAEMPPTENASPEGSFVFKRGMQLLVEFVDTGKSVIIAMSHDRPVVCGRRHDTIEFVPDLNVDKYVDNWESVSRRHAALQPSGRSLNLQDLNSTNGTYINGTRFNAYETHELRSGDVVHLGNVAFRVTFLPAEKDYSSEEEVKGDLGTIRFD